MIKTIMLRIYVVKIRAIPQLEFLKPEIGIPVKRKLFSY